MELKLSTKSLEKFAVTPVLTTNYYQRAGTSLNIVGTQRTQNFNTLDVVAPVRVPQPLAPHYYVFKIRFSFYEHKNAVLRALDEHQVVIVTADDASAKSTQLPQFLLDEACERERHCRVICVQPRELNIFNSSASVADERGEFLGSTVGSQTRLKYQYGLTTALIYCSSDIVLNTLKRRETTFLQGITHIIIDDVHERDPLCDLILVFLREHLKVNNMLRVVLTTTSRRVDQYAAYFGEDVHVHNLPRFDVPVNRFFLEDIIAMFYNEQFGDNAFEFAMSKCVDEPRYFDMLVHLIRCNGDYANRRCSNGHTPLSAAIRANKIDVVHALLNPSYVHNMTPPEDVALIGKIIAHVHRHVSITTLVFLPCYEDLVVVRENLLLTLPMNASEYEIVLVHEGTGCFICKTATAPSCRHKIVLATSVLEGSIIVPNVSYVIDTGKIQRGRFADVTTEWITQEAANRRASKAVYAYKVCFHLYTRCQHDAFPIEDKPRIATAPLQGLCLRAKLLPVPIRNLFQLMVEPPPEQAVMAAVEDLKILGALDIDCDLTELGSLLVQLSVEPRLGKMLVFAVILRCLDPILTIVACLSYKNPIVLPYGTTYRDIDFLREHGEDFKSDHLLLLKVYQEWQRLKTSNNTHQLQRLCFNWHTLEMIHEMRGELLSQLRGTGFVNLHLPGKIKELNENSNRWPVVKAVLASGCYTNVHFLRNFPNVSFGEQSALRADHDYAQLCVVSEASRVRPSHLHVEFGTAVTPLAVALMYKQASFKKDSPVKLHVQQGISNVQLFAAVLKEIMTKKIVNPTYEYNDVEYTFLTVAVDALCTEDADYNLPQPEGIGAMPKLFLNVRAKSTEQQLYELTPRAIVKSTVLTFTYDAPQKIAFRIVEAPSFELFYRSLVSSTWVFSPRTERKLLKHLRDNDLVRIFVTVPNSDYFHAVAELPTSNRENPKGEYNLRWISVGTVSFDSVRARNLRNICNDNRLISDGEDGQEIEYEAGLQLLNMFLY